MAKNVKEKQIVTLEFIKEMLEERFTKHEKTILNFISDNNKLLFEKLESVNRCIKEQSDRIEALEKLNDDFKDSLNVT